MVILFSFDCLVSLHINQVLERRLVNDTKKFHGQVQEATKEHRVDTAK